MIEIDHINTKVLLIGASEFPEDPTITPIPNVKANITNFKECLINPDIIGVPEANIIVSLNETRIQIERKLRDIAEETHNKKFTLLVYYTGHGILSSEDYDLYLTTYYTSKKYLEADGINIEEFKRDIKRSLAGRKIVFLDCCHSGAFIGAMNDTASSIQAELKGFEGTYVMTSAAEDTPSLFPVGSPDQPTYFTGKLLEVLNNGLESDNEYCSLREIYNRIEFDFKQAGLPKPQQSNFNNADQLFFSRNRKFVKPKAADELAWEEALRQNNKWAYKDFKKQFPESVYYKEAKKKIFDIEEEACWNKSLNRNSISAIDEYIDNYPEGKYVNEANIRLNELRKKEEQEEEEHYWSRVKNAGDLSSFQNYLQKYPGGRYAQTCQLQIERIKEEALTQQRQTEQIAKQKILTEQIRNLEQQADMLKKQGQNEEALSLYYQILQLQPNQAHSLKAVKQCKEEITAHKLLEEQIRDLEQQADIQKELGQNEEALKLYQQILQLQPNQAHSLQAAKECREEIAKQKLLAEQIRNLEQQAASLKEQGKNKEALKLYYQILKLQPNQAHSLKAVKECNEEIAAQRVLEEQIQDLEHQADTLQEQGEIEEALRLYHQILQLQPNRAHSLQAVKQCKKEITTQNLREDQIRQLEQQADILQEQGKIEEALSLYHQILQLEPNQAHSLQAVKQCHEEIASQKLLEELIRDLEQQADTLKEQGQHEEALRLYHQVLQLQPNQAHSLRAVKQCKKEIQRAATETRIKEVTNKVREVVDIISGKATATIGKTNTAFRNGTATVRDETAKIKTVLAQIITGISAAVNKINKETILRALYNINEKIVFGIAGLLALVSLFFIWKNFTIPPDHPDTKVRKNAPAVTGLNSSSLLQADTLFNQGKYLESLNLYEANQLKLTAEQMRRIAWIYENGDVNNGLDQVPKRSFIWYAKAAKSGNPLAMGRLGNFYYFGLNGAKVNELGNPLAMGRLGNYYYYKELSGVKVNEDSVVKINRDSAFYWYRLGAQHGDNTAMFNIGAMYLSGDGVNENSDSANIWFEKAYRNGILEAKDYLQ